MLSRLRTSGFLSIAHSNSTATNFFAGVFADTLGQGLSTLGSSTDRWSISSLDLNFPGHEVVVKRLFKHFEANQRSGDVAHTSWFVLIASCGGRDQKTYHYDWQSRQSWYEERVLDRSGPIETIKDQYAAARAEYSPIIGMTRIRIRCPTCLNSPKQSTLLPSGHAKLPSTARLAILPPVWLISDADDPTCRPIDRRRSCEYRDDLRFRSRREHPGQLVADSRLLLSTMT